MPRIRQEVLLDAAPERVYRALTDAAQHTSFTGAPAQIEAQAGGAFSAYGGRVLGRTVELVPNERIVQAWRSADWPAGVYTILRLELTPAGKKTQLVLEQDAIPEDMQGHLEGGWHKMYWEPLRKYLA